jgi:hypothetical protein
MSFATTNMVQTDNAPHGMGVSLKQHAELPHILRQSNYLGSSDMRTASVNFRVKPHTDAPAPALVQREHQELFPTHSTAEQQRGDKMLYPTQSTTQQALSLGEHDWSKHEIVASVAGLASKLTELDSEIRKGAAADASVSVMRQVQDHANLLRENAKQLQATQSKHKEVTALSHKILSQMHDNTQQQSAALETCQDDMAKLKDKHSTSIRLMHDICSEFQQTHLEHAEDKESLQRDVALLQQKDVVAQALLGKMLTMLDSHESAMSQDKGMSPQHLALLDGLCDAFEKTKTKFRTFEEAQRDMQKVLADFNANKLAAGAHHSEALEAKLDRYMRVNKDIDGRCTEALQQHGAKLQEMQRAQELALHDHRMKMQQLERAHQLALDEQHSKIQTLERKFTASQAEQRKIAELEGRLQEIALQQLNASQGSSISRVLERDVKHIQHQLNSMHALKKDVETMQEATSNTVSSVTAMRADLRKMQADNQARNEHSLALHKDVELVKQAQQSAGVDKSLAEMQAKMLDMRRDMTLEKIRVDKTASSVHNIECKLAA